MSEMTEVNHGMPSLNGSNLLPTTTEGTENSSSTQIKTSIPMQEVSAAREEPAPAAVHYLPSDDRSTAAAASAAADGDSSMMASLPGAEENTKAVIEGPGHESDVRGMNGTGLAGVGGGQERAAPVAGMSSNSVPYEATSSGGESIEALIHPSQMLKESGSQAPCPSASLLMRLELIIHTTGARSRKWKPLVLQQLQIR